MALDKAPEGTVFTLTVPLDRAKTKFATYYLTEVDEQVFLAVKAMIDARKHFDGVRLLLKALSLPGSDSVDLLQGKTGFIGLNSASVQIGELIEPLEGELKKN